MYSHYETIHTEERDGFTIQLAVTIEYDEPDWDFESEEQRQDTIERINDGRLAYFIARVSASKNDIKLATDYLGGCCYQSTDDFINEPAGYYQDMVEQVLNEAKSNIQKLCEAA